jgi:hypothetical protein
MLMPKTKECKKILVSMATVAVGERHDAWGETAENRNANGDDLVDVECPRIADLRVHLKRLILAGIDYDVRYCIISIDVVFVSILVRRIDVFRIGIWEEEHG